MLRLALWKLEGRGAKAENWAGMGWKELSKERARERERERMGSGANLTAQGVVQKLEGRGLRVSSKVPVDGKGELTRFIVIFKLILIVLLVVILQ